jgi:hypothetical protein
MRYVGVEGWMNQGFSHRCGVLKRLWTLHSVLGVPALIGLFRPVCFLSSTCLSLFYRSDWLPNPIACASFPCLILPPSFVDSLDSELWRHFGCRAAALASSSTSAAGSLSGSFHHAQRAPSAISSLMAESTCRGPRRRWGSPTLARRRTSNGACSSLGRRAGWPPRRSNRRASGARPQARSPTSPYRQLRWSTSVSTPTGPTSSCRPRAPSSASSGQRPSSGLLPFSVS